MKRTIVLFLVVLTWPHFITGRKITTLTEVINPNALVMDSQQMYVRQGSTVFIYGLPDYAFKKKFGREGEGPREFKRLAEIIPHPDMLQINSMNKVSFFRKDGTFIKEVKIANGYRFTPTNSGYVGRGTLANAEDNLNYITVNLVDRNFNKIKEMARMLGAGQEAGKPNVLTRKLGHATSDNHIFIASKDGLIIDVFDANGMFLHAIKKEYEKIPITKQDIRLFGETIKKRNPGFYEMVKNRWVFPKFFPEIFSFLVRDGWVYVLTYRQEKGKRELLIFDWRGKFIKSLMIPLEFRDFFTPYPFDIKNRQLVQLVENAEENWDLHVLDLEN